MSHNLTKAFEDALDADSTSRLDRIEERRCTSDNFDGVQYNIYGSFIDIRAIIDVVAERDGLAIEQLHHTNDSETCLGVFVAEIPEQQHPAFVN